MSSAVVSDFSSVSALFNIEVAAINGKAPSVDELIAAVRSDVQRELPVSKTAFFKYFAGNDAITVLHLEEVIHLLKDGVMRSLEKAPDASLSYAHAAIICSSEVAARKD